MNQEDKSNKKALFSMGCFWEPDDFFSKLDGVIKTRVGYTGGTTPNPTYEKLGDHTETIEITYDSSKISYEQLLYYFWQRHDPTSQQIKQYISAIYYLDEEQKKHAEDTKQKYQYKNKKPVHTQILPATTFYEAEEYHQKYLEKMRKKNII